MQMHTIIDGKAVEALVESVQERVSCIAYQYSGPLPGMSHEDLVSVGMTKAMSAAKNSLPGLDPARCPKARDYTYLVVAARNAIIDQYREGYGDPLKRPARVNPSPLISLDVSSFSLYEVIPSPALVSSSDDRDFSLLYKVINSLPEIYREVVCMKFGLCGYGVHRTCEIAHALHISPSTVKYRLRHALAVLRKHTELLALVGNGHGDGSNDVPVVADQGDDSEELARVTREFESVPPYVERYKAVRGQI